MEFKKSWGSAPYECSTSWGILLLFAVKPTGRWKESYKVNLCLSTYLFLKQSPRFVHYCANLPTTLWGHDLEIVPAFTLHTVVGGQEIIIIIVGIFCFFYVLLLQNHKTLQVYFQVSSPSPLFLWKHILFVSCHIARHMNWRHDRHTFIDRPDKWLQHTVSS